MGHVRRFRFYSTNTGLDYKSTSDTAAAVAVTAAVQSDASASLAQLTEQTSPPASPAWTSGRMTRWRRGP